MNLLALVVPSLGIVWGLVWAMHRTWRRVPQATLTFLGGSAPTILLVVGLIVLDRHERAVYAAGPQDGYMSPLVGLLYGFPFILLNLVLNFVVAHRLAKRAR